MVHGATRRPSSASQRRTRGGDEKELGAIFSPIFVANFGNFLAGSFSAVAKRNFVDEVERKTSRKTSKIQKNRKKMKNVYVKIT